MTDIIKMLVETSGNEVAEAFSDALPYFWKGFLPIVIIMIIIIIIILFKRKK